jgi:hypothetical protein
MGFEVVILVIVFAIPLLAGFALIVDALKRAVNEMRENNL